MATNNYPMIAGHTSDLIVTYLVNSIGWSVVLLVSQFDLAEWLEYGLGLVAIAALAVFNIARTRKTNAERRKIDMEIQILKRENDSNKD